MARKTERSGEKLTVFKSLVKLHMKKEPLQNIETNVKEIRIDHL